MEITRINSSTVDRRSEARAANRRCADLAIAALAPWLVMVAGPVNAQASSPAAAPAPTGSTPCNCQDERDATEGAGMFWFGPGFFDFSSLSDGLEANGYRRLANVIPVIGGEGRAVFGDRP